MPLNEIETYLYEKVLSKVHHDKENNEYIIHLSDYAYLNLSNSQFRKLKEICRRKRIKLEYTNAKLPIVEDLTLFSKYNDIKQKLILDKDNPKLEQIRIEIRNEIASQNFNAVRILLNRSITGLPQMKDREDIYQIGYTTLLEFIDAYDILEENTFTIAIKKYLIYHIDRKITSFRKNITNYANNSMLTLIDLKNNPEPEGITEEELATTLNTQVYHVKSLINLERILNPISLDEEIDTINQENTDEEKSILFRDTFENELIDNLSKEIILKVIKTLPKNQTEVLLLYYGFIDDRCYDITEIANMYGLTKERINEIKLQGLNNLRISIRSKYIVNLYEADQLYEEILPTEKEQKSLEDSLIKLIPQNELIEYSKKLSPLKREIMLMNYGLKDGICYNINTISKILDIGIFKAYKLKKDILDLLKYQILKKYYHIENPNLISYEEYLDYLMKIYLTKTNTKTKHK